MLCVFLCVDLDIIFIGEMCDKEMVYVGIEVFLMGYLVLLILYINFVFEIIICLFDLGFDLVNFLDVCVGILV